MNVAILIATPNEGIGELINQSLDEAGGYSLRLVKNAKETINEIKSKPPNICILDEGIEDIQTRDLCKMIRDMDKEISLILIPKGEKTNNPDEEFDYADGILPIPFFNPELLSLLEGILENQNPSNTKPSKKVVDEEYSLPAPDIQEEKKITYWLEDVSLAGKELTRLCLGSTSLGAIITRRGKTWATAGDLSQPAADELALSVEKYFGNRGGSDLARFIHLEETDKDYMLYATNLSEEFVLTTVFDSNIPFSIIRSQANQISSDLKDFPSQENKKEIKDKIRPHEQNLLKIKALLENSSSDQKEDEEFTNLEYLENGETLVEEKPSYESPAKVIDTKEDLQLEEQLAETQISTSSEENKLKESEYVQDNYEKLAETVLSKVSDDEVYPEEIVLESVSPSVYNLNYACVLIPRFSEHFLTGTRASRLSDWVSQLCLAFGWRLEQLSIRPEYIQWIVNVPPSTSPGYLIRIIRQHTSRRMFTDFPQLESTNASGDFWAPGYLIMNGNQAPPVNLIKDFISNSRNRQGV